MAKNWKFGEAVRAIKAGNKEDIMDIGRRFPLFLNLATQVNEAGMALIDCVPDYCTARKIESVLKGDVQESEAVEDEADEEEAPKSEKKAHVKKAAKKAEPVEDDEESGDELESKSAKELFDMCKKAGLNVKAKQDKAVYIEALKAAEEKADDEQDADDDWDDEEEEAPKKAPKKAPAKKAPAKSKSKAKEEDDDDDWDV